MFGAGNFAKGLKNSLGIDISTIPGCGFVTTASTVRRINFSNNNITAIEDNAFIGLSALTDLPFWGNGITAIGRNTFNGLTSLTALDMAANHITSLPIDTFA